jgi:hypothetical protein
MSDNIDEGLTNDQATSLPPDNPGDIIPADDGST